jgi:hypothetical protein
MARGGGSHKTGLVCPSPQRINRATDVLAAIKGKPNADHDFGKLMKEQDLIDLALFVTQGRLMPADQRRQGARQRCALAKRSTIKSARIVTDERQRDQLAPSPRPKQRGSAADNPGSSFTRLRGNLGWPVPRASRTSGMQDT